VTVSKVILLEQMPPAANASLPVQIDVSLAVMIRDLASGWQTGVPAVDAYNQSLALEALNAQDLCSGSLTDSHLTRHHSLIMAILSAYFAPNSGDEIMFAAIRPFSAVGFYASQKFVNTLLDQNYNFVATRLSRDSLEQTSMLRSLLSFILRKGYGQKIEAAESQDIFAVNDAETNLPRYFQFAMDHKFCEVLIAADAPEVKAEVFQDIMAHITDPLYGLMRLPLHAIRIAGVGMVRAFDVTSQVVMSQLKQKVLSATLERQREFLAESEEIMQTLCRDPRVRIAIWVRQESAWMRMTSEQDVDVFHCSGEQRFDKQKLQGTIFENPDRDSGLSIECLYSKSTETSLDRFFKDRGDATLMAFPLVEGEEQIGFLELTTSRKVHTHGYDLSLLREAANLFAIAVLTASEAYKARMDSVIKANCTAIHPAVEWKFKSSAVEAIRLGSTGVMGPIVFDHVYPLYAVCDIRGSSAQRARAIQRDLIQNLDHVREIFSLALTPVDVPALRFLLYKISTAQQSLSSSMVAGLELEVFRLINEELHPALEMVRSLQPNLAPRVDAYLNLVANDHRSVYEARRQFDLSVEALNRDLAACLDRRQISAQGVVPHYFEKHLTDGVDHSIYVGHSIDESGRFSEITLKNLRLWQFETMCELAKVAHQMKRKTAIPLETCQLIVAQDAPLTVGFRFDERKFDVYGAYNIRYELMKKRIEKAVIKGTGERLTQPGTICVVLSQDSERHEYEGYANYLEARGLIESKIQLVDIDDLQDVSGLRSLRVVLKKSYLDQVDGDGESIPSHPTKAVA
jgi:hypothetical protein